MADTKRRTRTGCLTCRARRVKCDETKPTCRRCEAANVECTGYETKRQVDIKRPKRSVSTADSPSTPASGSASDAGVVPLQPIFPKNGLPLVGLPSNPVGSQRPHARARDILAYHQFLFRSLLVLFPPEYLGFWKDFMCQAAWDTEYVYDAIMALGSVHRASLMRSKPGSYDQNKGMDAQVIATRAYTRALQELSNHIQEAQTSTPPLVGCLILFAYFECFVGNIPSAVRHILTARRYYRLMAPDIAIPRHAFAVPLESALQDLEMICRMVVPFPRLIAPLDRKDSVDVTDMQTPNSEVAVVPVNSSMHLQQTLLDMVTTNTEIAELIWNPLGPSYRIVAVDKINAFVEDLKAWRAAIYDNLILTSEAEELLTDPDHSTLHDLDLFVMPPSPVAGVPRDVSLLMAQYNFYRLRLAWALSILGDKNRRLELEAYHFLYQHLRCVATVVEPAPSGTDEAFVNCESLKVNFGPMLHLSGYCSPNLEWLRWIIRQLQSMHNVCLFNNKAYANSLSVWSSLERSSEGIIRQRSFESFSSPTSRVIAIILPDVSGKNFTTYYAKPQLEPQQDGSSVHSPVFAPLGIATWSRTNPDQEPLLDVFDTGQQPFDSDWLSAQTVVGHWVEWSRHLEFNFDRALRDHIDGGHLPYSMETPT